MLIWQGTFTFKINNQDPFKMKNFLKVSLLMLLPVFFSCSREASDLKRWGLKGKVKSVTEQQYTPTHENGKWVAGDKSMTGYRLVTYDPEGNYLQTLNISSNGDTLGMTVVKRENGELVEEINYARMYMTPKQSKLVPTNRTVMERVSDTQTNFEVWQGEKLQFEGATYFNSKGRVDRQVHAVNDREVVVQNVYEKDLLVEMYQMEQDGTRSGTQLFEYDEFDAHGNWTRKLVYVGEEKITPEAVIIRKLEYY